MELRKRRRGTTRSTQDDEEEEEEEEGGSGSGSQAPWWSWQWTVATATGLAMAGLLALTQACCVNTLHENLLWFQQLTVAPHNPPNNLQQPQIEPHQTVWVCETVFF